MNLNVFYKLVHSFMLRKAIMIAFGRANRFVSALYVATPFVPIHFVLRLFKLQVIPGLDQARINSVFVENVPFSKRSEPVNPTFFVPFEIFFVVFRFFAVKALEKAEWMLFELLVALFFNKFWFSPLVLVLHILGV